MKGKIIDSRYELVRKIGEGGSCDVWLARDAGSVINRSFCVKVIKKSSNTRILTQYRHEASLLDSLRHPGITSIIYYSEDEEYSYIVMDYIDGETLSKKLKREGPQNSALAVSWAVELCGILSYLHHLHNEPIVYLDMNPRNIMLDSHGKLHLLDFGISERIRPGRKSDQPPMGTDGFAAPEQYAGGSRILTPATDVYGLGATLYTLLTGKKLSPKSRNPCLVNPAVPASVGRVVERAVSPLPSKRQKSMDAFSRELQAAVRTGEGHRKKLKRNVIIPLVFFAATLISLGLALVSAAGLSDGRDAVVAGYVSQAKASMEKGDMEAARDSCLEAVSLDRSNPELYIQLMEIMMPGAESFDYETQTRNAVDTVRYAAPESVFKKSPELTGMLLSACTTLSDPVYSQFASSLLPVLEKAGYREQAKAYGILIDHSLGNRTDEKERKEVEESLYEAAADSSLEDGDRLSRIDVLVKILNRYPEDIDKERFISLSNRIRGLESGDSDFRGVIPLNTLLAARFHSLYRDTGDPDYMRESASWIGSVNEAFLSADSRILKAEILEDSGDPKGAKAVYRAVLDSDPDSVQALLGMISSIVASQEKEGKTDYSEAFPYYDRLTSMTSLSAATINQINALAIRIGRGGQ